MKTVTMPYDEYKKEEYENFELGRNSAWKDVVQSISILEEANCSFETIVETIKSSNNASEFCTKAYKRTQ